MLPRSMRDSILFLSHAADASLAEFHSCLGLLAVSQILLCIYSAQSKRFGRIYHTPPNRFSLSLSFSISHAILGILLRTLDILTHILGQIKLMELRVIMDYHGKFISLIK